MYHVLTPLEKLAYLLFWRAKGIDDAYGKIRGKRGVDSEGFYKAVGKLEKEGLLMEENGKLKAVLGYMAEIIERENHLYPERRLSGSERKALVAFLRSEKFTRLAEGNIDGAVHLYAENREVLSGFFWSRFGEVAAIAQAYYVVYGDQPSVSEVGEDFDDYLKKAGQEEKKHWDIVKRATARGFGKSGLLQKIGKEKLDFAFSDNFVFLFPRELAEYLRWSVNTSPLLFVAEKIFREIKR